MTSRTPQHLIYFTLNFSLRRHLLQLVRFSVSNWKPTIRKYSESRPLSNNSFHSRYRQKCPWTNAYFLFCSSLPTEFMFDFIIILMCFPFEKAERLKHSIEISNAYEFFSGKLSDYRISFIQWNHMFWSILNLCYIVRWEIQRPILSGIIWVTNYSLRILPNRVLIKLKPSSASCCFLDFVGLRGVIFHETRHTTALARASLEQLCLV